MNIIEIDGNTDHQTPCVATIGFFDGVHRGHRYLISTVVNEAHYCGMESTVITFDRHPRQVLNSEFQPELLSTYDEKMILLSKTEIDNCAVLHFDEAMAQLSAYDFMRTILRDRLNVKKLVIGYDNRFGAGSKEGINDYVRYGKELGIEVICGQPFVLNGVNVSSSVVRSFLSEGEVELAHRCLSYPYTIRGRVVDGEQEGRKLGFPTANLSLDGQQKLIPAPGVYAVKARLENSVEMKHAMMNIGTRPTFGGNTMTLEVHIMNFDGELYGQSLIVSFIHRLREERRFKSAAELVAQLKEDERMVQEQFQKDIEE